MASRPAFSETMRWDMNVTDGPMRDYRGSWVTYASIAVSRWAGPIVLAV
jgi:hypothetical protein